MQNLTATQETTYRIVEVHDKRGNKVPLDPAVVPDWKTDNTDILTITPSADGMTCHVRPVGMVTSTPVHIQVTADADTTDAVKNVIGTDEINVTPGEAATIVIKADTPTEQPE